MAALLAALLLACPNEASGGQDSRLRRSSCPLPVAARSAQKVARDPRTAGLGKSCKKNADCKHRSQRCIHQSDAQGKPLDKGFCVLPCASFEAGTQKVTPGAPVDVSRKAKKPPPRCPARYECRSAGAGVPIDMCVKN